MYNILQYQKWWGFLEYFIYSSVVKVSVMRRHNTGSSIKLGVFFYEFSECLSGYSAWQTFWKWSCTKTGLKMSEKAANVQRKTLKACEKHRRAIAQEYFNN